MGPRMWRTNLCASSETMRQGIVDADGLCFTEICRESLNEIRKRMDVQLA